MTPPSPSIILPLYRLSGTLFVGGCLWGGLIYTVPFPRLALAGHIGLMSNAMATVCAGVVVSQIEKSKMPLSSLSATCIYWGLCSAWPMAIRECMNSFWGGKELLPLAAGQAGANGSTFAKEKFVSSMHILHATGYTMAWLVICRRLLMIRST
ncbi:hypothetical protein F5884DRAFT_856834 [Xylogone sp. PMI_703]|nr:hypothetical protein F5884DRAFT_856834 [Xylogone sp. PMI_703]